MVRRVPKIGNPRHSKALFPYTSALSLREGVHQRSVVEPSRNLRFAD